MIIENARSYAPGTGVVFQPSRVSVVTFGNGIYVHKSGVYIKNDSDEPIKLKVTYLGDSETWITTSFYPGWNPDIISQIDTDDLIYQGSDIKVGF